MEPPVLLDENVEHELLYRLRNYGHTVEHVDLHDRLQKGDEDHLSSGCVRLRATVVG